MEENLHWLWLYQESSLQSIHHLPPALKEYLGGHKGKDNRRMETAVSRWLTRREKGFYQQTEKFVSKYDKYLKCGADCMQKLWKASQLRFDGSY